MYNLEEGDCITLKIGEGSIKLEIEKIEDEIAYFGKCKEGSLRISDVLPEFVDKIAIKDVDIISTSININDKNYPIKLNISRIKNGSIYFEKCKSSIPIESLVNI